MIPLYIFSEPLTKIIKKSNITYDFMQIAPKPNGQELAEIKEKIKMKSLLGAFSLLRQIKKGLILLFLFVGKLIKLTSLLLLPILLAGYKLYLFLKRKAQRLTASPQDRIFFIFAQRKFFKLVVVILVALIIFGSFGEQELRADTFGQGAILTKLVSRGDLIIEEKAIISESGGGNSYKPVSSPALGGALQARSIMGGEEMEIEESLVTALDASALMKTQIASIGPKTRTEAVEYVVLPGDTVSSIADKFGVSVNTILWENELRAWSLIRPGDKLVILQSSGINHKVARGDTLDKIAKKYKVDTEKIKEFNRLADASAIKVGEKLFIPGASPYSPPVSVSPSRFFPTPQIPAGGGYLWPTINRRITQYFYWRHPAIDIGGQIGTPIYAADAGRVIEAKSGWNGGYGLHLIIDHGNSKKTLYAHASKLAVAVGDYVNKGQVIAYVGNTGRSSGPHLHFELIIGGRKVNPLSYLR